MDRRRGIAVGIDHPESRLPAMRGRNGVRLQRRAAVQLAALAQRVQQASQAVVIDFVHQRELSAELAARKPFAG
ncbi:hypothetical protein IST439_06039 [Burkholderia cenocepacia]|nr:hypothetical protein IST439_06039 [Burkholderia cenocepacia]